MLRFTTSSGRDVAPGFSELRPIAAGRILFRQDDRPQSMAFVADGWVMTVRQEWDGGGRGVALYPPGSLLGLAELIAGQKYPETAIALSLCRLRWITAPEFYDLIETDRGFFRQIYRVLGRQNHAQEIYLAQRGSLSLRLRLEQLIWQLLRTQSRDCAVPGGMRGECKLLAPVQNRDLARMSV